MLRGGMINTRRDELRSGIFSSSSCQHCRDFNSNNFARNNETRGCAEIHSRRASKLHLIGDLLPGFDASPYKYPRAEKIRSTDSHAYERRRNETYNCTHVVLGEGRRDWPVAGFPFVRDADRLRRFLLHRLRLVEQRQLVKLLDICNSPEKKEKTYYHLPRSSRRSEGKISADRMTSSGLPDGGGFHFVSIWLSCVQTP